MKEICPCLCIVSVFNALDGDRIAYWSNLYFYIYAFHSQDSTQFTNTHPRYRGLPLRTEKLDPCCLPVGSQVSLCPVTNRLKSFV
jgi:hypothetical protein